MKVIRKYGTAVGIVVFTLLVSWLVPPVIQKIKHLCPVRPNGIQDAQAVSQWARKYGMSCNTCHSAFPRLNYFGEQFQRNGYQMPGTEDGDEAGKRSISDLLKVDELGNFFGIRLNVTPVRIQSNDLTVNGKAGDQHRVSFGNPNWLQFFTAGSMFKNVSIFIETELVDGGTINNSWFRFGFHNLLGLPGLMNFYVGKLAPMEFTAASGRLRMIGPQNLALRVLSAKNTGEDSVRMAGGRPGIQFYGYAGPMVYSLGVDNGSKTSDPNQHKNFFGSLKLEKPSEFLGGSSFSLFAYSGKDTKDTATAQKVSNFYRISPAFNLREGNVDVIGAFLYGEDDNWTLVATKPKKVVHRGGLGQVGYLKGRWYGVLQWDVVDSADDRSLDAHYLTPSIWYLVRDNFKIGLVPQIDLLPTNHPSHKKEKHDIYLNIRAMY